MVCKRTKSLFFSWYSHKINESGLRYEVAITIRKARILSFIGPWPAGSYPEITIFRSGIKKNLMEDEFCIAKDGYNDTRCIHPPGESCHRNTVYHRIRARHETINKRLKHFSVLKQRFQHSIPFHRACFHAIANTTCIMLESSPMFSI